MCKHKSLMPSLSSNLVLKVMQQDDASCCWVCDGRFHGILPKEYSVTFHGDYLKRCLLTHRVSQVLLLTRLISEIKYIAAIGLFSKYVQLTSITVSSLDDGIG